ncbi:hypothetical protein Tco_0564482 [Tanacetum coccineum]
MSVEDLVVRLRIEEEYKNENVVMIAMVSDVCAHDLCGLPCMVTNNSGWWVDTGATCHVCADKSMFYSFRAVDNGEKLYMGNSATADIQGMLLSLKNIFPVYQREMGASRLDDKVFQDKRQRDDNDLHDERQDQNRMKKMLNQEGALKGKKREIRLDPILFIFMVEFMEPTSYREAVIPRKGNNGEMPSKVIESILPKPYVGSSWIYILVVNH